MEIFCFLLLPGLLSLSSVALLFRSRIRRGWVERRIKPEVYGMGEMPKDERVRAWVPNIVLLADSLDGVGIFPTAAATERCHRVFRQLLITVSFVYFCPTPWPNLGSHRFSLPSPQANLEKFSD
ncbi:hypothetical protein GGS23DRAFT_278968 [Durotheca rogersii]|uniref:uncharacterized protein n=1 Tax=Durotheca rogersii TaxID=419775 RepID=UPI00221EE9CA|nr:uncharacterized protein GGS23DRAFT_278968 [Durotheca rogersii]KAI5866606.1 hypothetical protein GGS23DRAFT_278968 [Durotheca rogersii]